MYHSIFLVRYAIALCTLQINVGQLFLYYICSIREMSTSRYLQAESKQILAISVTIC